MHTSRLEKKQTFANYNIKVGNSLNQISKSQVNETLLDITVAS